MRKYYIGKILFCGVCQALRFSEYCRNYWKSLCCMYLIDRFFF